MSNITRRRFLEDSVLVAAAAAAVPSQLIAAEERAQQAPMRKSSAAIIGCGIRGKQHASELVRHSDCEIAYVCDPDRERAAEVASPGGERSSAAESGPGFARDSRGPMRLTLFSLRRPTIGTRWRRSGRCKRARMCMWRNR